MTNELHCFASGPHVEKYPDLVNESVSRPLHFSFHQQLFLPKEGQTSTALCFLSLPLWLELPNLHLTMRCTCSISADFYVCIHKPYMACVGFWSSRPWKSYALKLTATRHIL